MPAQPDDPQRARPTPTASPWQVAARRLNWFRVAALIYVLVINGWFWAWVGLSLVGRS